MASFFENQQLARRNTRILVLLYLFAVIGVIVAVDLVLAGFIRGQLSVCAILALLYSIGLLVTGIKWKTSKVRWAALVLMVGTAFKIFFMDLWRLGQLYRVASFIGLAAVLILVSFLYQRFMTGKDEEEKRGG